MSTNLLKDQQLMILAGKIGNCWQYLAIGYLGFSKPEVDHFMSEGGTHQDKVFRMLYEWKCQQKHATIISLIRILDKAKINPDALEYLKSEYNNGKKKIQPVKARKRKESCELEIPERKINKTESSVEFKNLSDFHAKETGTSSSYEPLFKQMKISNNSKQEEVSEQILSMLTKKEDAVQLKSKKESVERKGKQRKTPVTEKPPRKKQEAKPKQLVQESTSAETPVTKKPPKKKQEAKPKPLVQESTSAETPVTEKSPKKKQVAKPKPLVQDTISAVKKVKKITVKAKPPMEQQINSQTSESLQMKLFEQKNLSPKDVSMLSVKKDGTQPKSKEESVQTKNRKKTPVTEKPPRKKQEAKPKQLVQTTINAAKSEKNI